MIAHKRLARELMALQKEPPALIHARPLESNILHFHYVLEGPPGTPYAGGAYHGVLKFPSEYPHKAPSVLMYTPSGRFQPNTRICMSM
jgi:ubiquitin-conjugating enzyme E2 J2